VLPIPPAPFAELVALVVRLADSAAAAVAIGIADTVRAHTAADIVIWIAASTAARGVPRAALSIAAASAGSTVSFPAPVVMIIVVSLVVPPPSLATMTDTRAALTFPAARIPRETAPLDERVVTLGESEICPSQGDERRARCRYFLQSRAPVLKSSEHTSPIVKPTIVHGESLLSLW